MKIWQKRGLWALAGLLLLPGLLLWWLWPAPEPLASGPVAPSPAAPAGPGAPQPNPPPRVSAPNPAYSPARNQLGVENYSKQLAQDPAFAQQELTWHLEHNPRARATLRAIGMALQPISLSGRVVNQQGEPLADAEVHYQLAAPFGLANPVLRRARTDANGYFALKNQLAAYLVIVDIQKKGYQLKPLDFNGALRAHPQPGERDWRDYTSNNPLTLTVGEVGVF